MEKSRLLFFLAIVEGWFYLSALAWVISLLRIAKKLNTPIMMPYKPLFLRLAVCASSLVFAGLMVLVFLFNRTWWQVLFLAEIVAASSFTYFVFKLSHTWKEIQRSNDLNELRFIESNKYKALIDSSPNAVVSCNSSGQIVDWNGAAKGIFGYDEAEVIGKQFTILIPERHVPKYLFHLKNFMETGKKFLIGRTIETEGLRRNGKEFSVRISLAEYKTRNEQRFTAIVQDLTKDSFMPL